MQLRLTPLELIDRLVLAPNSPYRARGSPPLGRQPTPPSPPQPTGFWQELPVHDASLLVRFECAARGRDGKLLFRLAIL
jgi:hypothetical protein